MWSHTESDRRRAEETEGKKIRWGSHTLAAKSLWCVTCTSAAVLPKRLSIFRGAGGMYTKALWRVGGITTTNRAQHAPTKRRPSSSGAHTVTRHRHERKEEQSTGTCGGITFSAEILLSSNTERDPPKTSYKTGREEEDHTKKSKLPRGAKCSL